MPIPRHTPHDSEELWVQLSVRIAESLTDLGEDEFLIISHKKKNYYVQFADQGFSGVRVEATSNSYIEPEAALIAEQYELMAELGWQRATEAPTPDGAPEHPDGSPNFYMDVARPVDLAGVGELAVTTLRTVYGVKTPGELQYRAFTDEDEEIRFPRLGLKRSES